MSQRPPCRGTCACRYIIRTDVMYERRPPVCTEPNDIEAFAMYEHARMLGGNAGSELEAAQLFRKCFKLSPTLARIYGMQ